MSQQDGTSLFFYSASLLVDDYESGREVPVPARACKQIQDTGEGNQAMAFSVLCVCVVLCVLLSLSM